MGINDIELCFQYDRVMSTI